MQEKEQDKMNKLKYGDTLKQQMELKNSHSYGIMTDVEKKLNKPDLSGYKHAKRDINCVIPGINHIESIGSKATYRTGIKLSPSNNNIKMDQSLSDKIKNFRENESRGRSLRRSLSRQKMGNQDKQIESHNRTMVRNLSEFKIKGGPVSRSHRRGLASTDVGVSKHNPITNPLNTYNPYAKYAREKVLNKTNDFYNLP